MNDIIDNFDWEKVHRAMLAVNWRWATGGVPSVELLRDQARSLLRDVILTHQADRCDGDYIVSTGGLVATYNGKQLKLEFILETYTIES